MKDRILFYIDFQFFHFGIARYLQEKYDCDSFAIIDLNDRPKKFFEKQQLVKFRKTWQFRDHVTPSQNKADMNYLISFEQKYKINLWNIAYTERAFNQYNNYYKFTYDEIISILEQECKFFEQVLDEVKPDFLSMYLTDWHHMHLLAEICRARGVKVLMLTPTRLNRTVMIADDYDKMDETVDYKKNPSEKDRTAEDSKKYLKDRNAYKSITQENVIYSNKWKMLKASIQFFLFSNNNRYRTNYTNYGKTRLKAILVETRTLLKRKYREYFMNRNLVKKIDDKIPYVYYPMHYDPERALLIGAPYYADQLWVIENIAKSLPVGYHLYVKDHPVMAVPGWRSTSYYKQILDLPNVTLLHPSISPEEVLRNCKLVINIAGSSSMEAALYEKPVIILADFWGNSKLSWIYKLPNIEELPNTIRTVLQLQVKPEELSNYINLIERNSFEFDFVGLFSNVLKTFYYDGFLTDVDIQISKMDSFLNEHKIIFERLANEHIKKITQYKKLEKNKIESI